MFPIHKVRESIVPSSGNGSANTLKFSGAELIQLYTKAATSTTIYDLSLVDEDGDVVLEFNAIEGEHEEHAIYIPLRGVYTIQITDSTRDEAIITKLMIEE